MNEVKTKTSSTLKFHLFRNQSKLYIWGYCGNDMMNSKIIKT